MCKNKSEEDKYKSLKIAESCESIWGSTTF